MQPQVREQLPVKFTAACFAALPAGCTWRSGSYIEDDLQRDGSSYDGPGFPINRVVSAGQLGVFGPSSHAGGSSVLDGVAYATYQFFLPNYDQAPTIGFTWDTGAAPAYAGDCWVGLANWPRGRWDWYAAPADCVLTLPGMASYLEDGTGRLLLVVLLMGDKTCMLRRIHFSAPELRGAGALPDTGILSDSLPSFAPELVNSLPAASDISADCPPVRDQGQAAASTAFAVADCAFSAELRRAFLDCGWDLAQPGNIASPQYLYVETGKAQNLPDAGTGRRLGECVTWLCGHGIATEANAPYTGGVDAVWGPAAKADAQVLQAQRWLSLSPTDTRGLGKLKTIIAIHHQPVILRINLDAAFMTSDGSANWLFTGPSLCTQALVLVGYDDARGAFKARNSWGPDWADGGCVWLDYGNFSTVQQLAQPWCWTIYTDYSAAVAQRFCTSEAELPAPGAVEAGITDDKARINLSWEAVPGADSYTVYRDKPDLVAATDLTATSWIDFSVSDTYSHSYWVQASAANLDSSLSAPVITCRAQPPKILSLAPVMGGVGATVQFSATVTGHAPLHYFWDFGGAALPNTSSEACPVVQLQTSGEYEVSLQVINSNGEDLKYSTLVVEQQVYLFPDPADADWGSPVTGSGTQADPFVLDAADPDKQYSLRANPQPDGSGTWLDNSTLTWDADPEADVSWVEPGIFQAKVGANCRLFAECQDGKPSMNGIYIILSN